MNCAATNQRSKVWPILQHVEAVVKFLDCSAKSHRLHVIVDSQ